MASLSSSTRTAQAEIDTSPRAKSWTDSYQPFPCYGASFGKQVRLFDTNHALWNAVRAAVFSYCLGHRCAKVKA